MTLGSVSAPCSGCGGPVIYVVHGLQRQSELAITDLELAPGMAARHSRCFDARDDVPVAA